MSLLDESSMRKLISLIDRAKNVVLVSHLSPDADSIGANIAMRTVLEKKAIKVISACIDKPPKILNFLTATAFFVQDFDIESVDLFITIDCGSLGQVRFEDKLEFIQKSKIPFVNIDHHATNNHFGELNIVETRYAATCEILYRFFSFAGYEIDKEIATALMTGLYYDTGAFMHSNVSSENLDIAAHLLELGADFQTIVKNLYKTKPFEQLKLWGIIWNRARINDKNIVISAVTDEDISSCDATREHLSGAIDYLNMIKDSKFCMLLTENEGKVKASVRTQRDDIDLSQLSSVFGGGGHKKASGFSVHGKIEKEIEVKWRISV